MKIVGIFVLIIVVDNILIFGIFSLLIKLFVGNKVFFLFVGFINLSFILVVGKVMLLSLKLLVFCILLFVIGICIMMVLLILICYIFILIMLFFGILLVLIRLFDIVKVLIVEVKLL